MVDESVEVQRFPPSNGRFTGYLGLAIGPAVLVLAGVYGGLGPALVVGVALFEVVVWLVMLRPAVWVEGDVLVLRHLVRTDRVPLAAVTSVVVRHVLAVFAGERRFVSPTIARSSRQLIGEARAARRGGRPSSWLSEVTAPAGKGVDQADFVEQRLRHLAEQARLARGVAARSPEQEALLGGARRSTSWPWVGVVVVLAVALVVTLLG